jgi:hypothetical protein
VEPAVDTLVEISISARDDDVNVSMEVTSVEWVAVVDFSVDVEDLIKLVIVSNTVGEIVDSLDCAIEFVMNVDTVGSTVEISGEVDVFISFSSVDDNMSWNTSEVLVMTLIELVNVDVIE